MGAPAKVALRLTGARLRAWGRLGEARAPGRRARGLLGALATVGAAGAAAADSAGQASERLSAVTAVVIAALGLAVPQWIFWRRDAALLARLPIDGGALLGAAWRRAAAEASSPASAWRWRRRRWRRGRRRWRCATQRAA
ncbi:MAG: hypothetical protein R2939_07180 [Kofleriaceae bacterium]